MNPRLSDSRVEGTHSIHLVRATWTKQDARTSWRRRITNTLSLCSSRFFRCLYFVWVFACVMTWTSFIRVKISLLCTTYFANTCLLLLFWIEKSHANSFKNKLSCFCHWKWRIRTTTWILLCCCISNYIIFLVVFFYLGKVESTLLLLPDFFSFGQVLLLKYTLRILLPLRYLRRY